MRSQNITIESSIVLKDVFYVPQLTNSLIYIQKVYKDLNCSVTFLSPYCVFHDLVVRKTILVAKKQSELYLMESKGQNKTNATSQ